MSHESWSECSSLFPVPPLTLGARAKVRLLYSCGRCWGLVGVLDTHTLTPTSSTPTPVTHTHTHTHGGAAMFMLEHTSRCDSLDIIRNIRQDRCALVQHPQQYEFVYEAAVRYAEITDHAFKVL